LASWARILFKENAALYEHIDEKESVSTIHGRQHLRSRPESRDAAPSSGLTSSDMRVRLRIGKSLADDAHNTPIDH
jgi:hypothetical protein